MHIEDTKRNLTTPPPKKKPQPSATLLGTLVQVLAQVLM